MPNMVEEPVGADVDLDRIAVVVQRDGVGAAGVVLDAGPPGDRLVGEVNGPDPVEEPVGADGADAAEADVSEDDGDA